MRKIAIVNQKGGVGKTTTTINLGAALVREGKRVLIIDLDPQANLSYSLGLRGDNDSPTMYDVLRGTTNLKHTIYKHHASGLHFVPAHIDMTASEMELITQAGRELILKDEIAELGEDAYDYILVDCAPSLGILTLNALVACTEVMIPLQTEFLAMQGMTKLVETLGVIKKRLNPDISITGIIGTMYDSRKNLPGEVVASVKQHFGDKFFTTLIRENVSLAEAPSHHVDIFSYRADSNGAADYAALAKEVTKMEVTK